MNCCFLPLADCVHSTNASGAKQSPETNKVYLFSLLVSRPAVIGHSCCGVPANVLSVCLFVCLFVFGEANKIK